MKEDGQTSCPIIDGLLTRRTVVLEGEITFENTSALSQKILRLQMQSSAPINLIIDSGGGNTDAALKLCDLIDIVITAPIRGIALGKCGSAATFIMLYCNERICTPYSRFLIHSGTIGKISLQINDTTAENLEALLRDVRGTDEMVMRLYMNKLTPTSWVPNKPNERKCRAFIKKLIDRGDQQFDYWLSAEEAVEVGLIQRIVSEKLDIFE
jgi:ATP-dependent protease ClpP protease subunit